MKNSTRASGEFSKSTPKTEIKKPTTTDEYHSLWSKMTVDFAVSQPILAMCCSKAEKFSYDLESDTLKIWFTSDVNTLLLEDEKNKAFILEKLAPIGQQPKLDYLVMEVEKNDVDEKIRRIKELFSSDILKITKK